MALPKKSRSWFDSYIIVYNIKKADLVIPIILSPTGLGESISASYDQQIVPGRSAPVISYTSTGARSLSFSMRVNIDMLPAEYGKDLNTFISRIKSLMYPDYSNGLGIIKPPHCLVVIGKIKLDGVCTSFSVSYQDLYAKNGNHTIADIDLSFLEVLDSAPGNLYFISGKLNIINTAQAVTDSPYFTLLGKDSSGNTGEKQSKPFVYKKKSQNIWMPDFGPDISVMELRCTTSVVADNTVVVPEGSFTANITMLDYVLMSNILYKMTFYIYQNGKRIDSLTQIRYLKLVD